MLLLPPLLPLCVHFHSKSQNSIFVEIDNDDDHDDDDHDDDDHDDDDKMATEWLLLPLLLQRPIQV